MAAAYATTGVIEERDLGTGFDFKRQSSEQDIKEKIKELLKGSIPPSEPENQETAQYDFTRGSVSGSLDEDTNGFLQSKTGQFTLDEMILLHPVSIPQLHKKMTIISGFLALLFLIGLSINLIGNWVTYEVLLAPFLGAMGILSAACINVFKVIGLFE